MVLKKLTESGSVAVWGSGYLGYSTAVRLQRYGLFVNIWGPEAENLVQLERGEYPDKTTQAAWTAVGFAPPLRKDRLRIVSSADELAGLDCPVHVLALPSRQAFARNVSVWDFVGEKFRRDLHGEQERLIILSSAPYWGDSIAFANKLKGTTPQVSVCAAFRSDWHADQYFQAELDQVVGGSDHACELGGEFLKRVGVKAKRVGQMSDAEIYYYLQTSTKYVVSAYVNQLCNGFPGIDFNNIVDMALSNLDLSDSGPAIGAGGKQLLSVVDAILTGSETPESLTILKETELFNLRNVVSYAQLAVRSGAKNAAILGIAANPESKELVLSPSLVLAETLITREVKAYLHDPFFSAEQREEVVRGAKALNITQPFSASGLTPEDVVFLMTGHSVYREFTQRDIDERVDGQVALIIDNTGLWDHLTFKKTKYHRVGGGSLKIL